MNYYTRKKEEVRKDCTWEGKVKGLKGEMGDSGADEGKKGRGGGMYR